MWIFFVTLISFCDEIVIVLSLSIDRPMYVLCGPSHWYAADYHRQVRDRLKRNKVSRVCVDRIEITVRLQCVILGRFRHFSTLRTSSRRMSEQLCRWMLLVEKTSQQELYHLKVEDLISREFLMFATPLIRVKLGAQFRVVGRRITTLLMDDHWSEFHISNVFSQIDKTFGSRRLGFASRRYETAGSICGPIKNMPWFNFYHKPAR